MTGTPLSDFAAIEALALRYFDALYDGGVDAFAALFHPAARLYSAGGGTTTIMDVPTYLAIVKGRVNPRARATIAAKTRFCRSRGRRRPPRIFACRNCSFPSVSPMS